MGGGNIALQEQGLGFRIGHLIRQKTIVIDFAKTYFYRAVFFFFFFLILRNYLKSSVAFAV
jgi:hypothetical protein